MTQRQFDFKRASKLRALERVVCGKNVKALLKALDGFARDDRTCTVTLKRIGVSMGASEKTAQRTIRLAQAEGLLTVSGDGADGRANTYRIEWTAVFDLPDGVSGGRSGRAVETPVNSSADPGQNDRGGRSDCPPTPVNGDRGGRSTVTDPSPTDSIRQRTATVRQPEFHTANGGGLSPESEHSGRQPTAHSLPRSGAWAGHIEQSFPDDERRRLWVAACDAGLLDGSAVDRVRFIAAVLQARTRPEGKKTGWLVRRVELGDWNYLDPKWVQSAVDKCKASGIVLTPDQVRQVRTAFRMQAIQR